MIARTSNHPVALYDEQGKISPSSFIPFCSFGAKLIGPKVPNMTFPVCDIFEPAVFEGRLCYQVLGEKLSRQKVSEGKRSGLMLLIDVNTERSLDITSNETKTSDMSERDLYIGNDQVVNRNLASIHIGTLARYEGYGSGDYQMTAIKQMKGTKSFLAWPDHKRKCALESFERCQMKGFSKESLQCGCSPFQLLPATPSDNQVCMSWLCFLPKTDQNQPGLPICWYGMY